VLIPSIALLQVRLRESTESLRFAGDAAGATKEAVSTELLVAVGEFAATRYLLDTACITPLCVPPTVTGRPGLLCGDVGLYHVGEEATAD